MTMPTTVAVLSGEITKFNENFDNGTVNKGFLY